MILLKLACSTLLFSSRSVDILSSLGSGDMIDVVATFPIASRVRVFGFDLSFFYICLENRLLR